MTTPADPQVPEASSSTSTDRSAASGSLQWMLRACTVLAVLSLAGIAWLGAARLVPGVPAPAPWMRAAVILLVSGGIGFGTNWLAIKMLFRPRDPHPWLLFWPQGLLPREQGRLARALGRVAAERLLRPDAIVDSLNDEKLRAPLGRALRDELELVLARPETRELLTRAIARGLRERGPSLVRRLRPELRAAIEQAIDDHLTPDRILQWMRAAVHRFAANREMRRALAKWIIRQTSGEGVMTQIMEAIREQFFRYRERHPVRGFLAEQFVIDWDDLRRGIADTLKSEEATEDLANILVDAAGSVMERLHEADAAEFVADARRAILDRVLDWVEEEGVNVLAERVGRMADSPGAWQAVEQALDEMIERVPDALFDPEDGQLRPAVRARVNALQMRIVESFPVADIVERQVLDMDPAAVEAMVDEVGRRELAAIQVLGMVIGALAGGLLLLVL